jgi:alpha-N-arabinofuranosidase
VLNPTETEQRLALTIEGAALGGKGRLWRLAPSGLDATIVPGKPPGVEVLEQVLETVPGTATIPPISVSVYELPVKPGPSPSSEP